jgi:hypothetical protein
MEGSSQSNPPDMVHSSARPITSRTRRKIEQLDEDEHLAIAIALEEDAKIAAKY